MLATAKVFTPGNSQAVRFPRRFGLMPLRCGSAKNENTGDTTLRPKGSEDQRQRNLKELFRLIAENICADDFLPKREVSEMRNPFEDWAEPLPSQDPQGAKP